MLDFEKRCFSRSHSSASLEVFVTLSKPRFRLFFLNRYGSVGYQSAHMQT